MNTSIFLYLSGYFSRNLSCVLSYALVRASTSNRHFAAYRAAAARVRRPVVGESAGRRAARAAARDGARTGARSRTQCSRRRRRCRAAHPERESGSKVWLVTRCRLQNENRPTIFDENGREKWIPVPIFILESAFRFAPNMDAPMPLLLEPRVVDAVDLLIQSKFALLTSLEWILRLVMPCLTSQSNRIVRLGSTNSEHESLEIMRTLSASARK